MSSKAGHAFDVGNATRIALSIWGEGLAKGELDQVVQTKIDDALDKERNCGNGSLMRVAPIALVYFREPETNLKEYAAQSSRPTHPHAICTESCQFYVYMLAQILKANHQLSIDELELLLRNYDFKAPPLQSIGEKCQKYGGVAKIPESEIRSSGFVVHTLEAALWAFLSTRSFKDGAVKVVNLGDDADTVGAVYGGLAGAFYGLDEIPKEWLEVLQAKSLVDETVEEVVRLMNDGNG